jgi:hypothetical protein
MILKDLKLLKDPRTHLKDLKDRKDLEDLLKILKDPKAPKDPRTHLKDPKDRKDLKDPLKVLEDRKDPSEGPRGPRLGHMIVSVSLPRALALSLSVALTFTPAVVGACAALLCAPAADGAAVVADQGHAGHHGAPAAAGVPDEHAHHGSMHGAGHAEIAGVESVRTPAVSPRLQVRSWPGHDCCADAGSLAVAAVPAANRLDIAAQADAVVRAPGSTAGAGISDLPRPPTIPIESPHPSVSAPLVLRI